MKRKSVALGLIAIGVLFLAAVVIPRTEYRRGGVLLQIENVGDSTIRAPVVRTSGFTYSLRDLVPGTTDTVTVQTKTDGGVWLEHGNRGRDTMLLISYIVPILRDTIHIQLRADSVVGRLYP